MTFELRSNWREGCGRRALQARGKAFCVGGREKGPLCGSKADNGERHAGRGGRGQIGRALKAR